METFNIYGYFGFKNVGDDLMLINYLNHVDSIVLEKVKIRVFCNKNYYLFTRYNNIIVDVIELNKITNNFLMPYYILTASRGFWIGGTCLYEPDSRDISGLKWLHKLVQKYKYYKREFSFINIGIGSIHSPEAKKLSLEILYSASKSSFREDISLKIAQNWISNKKFILGGDMVFLGSNILKQFHNIPPKNHLGFAGHMQYYDNIDIIEFYSNILNKVGATYEKIVFISMHGSEDHLFHKKLAENINIDSHFIEYSDYAEFFKNIRELKFLIGMRLHSVILSDLLAVPNIGVAYGEKINNYIQKSNQLVQQRTKQIAEDISFKEINYILDNYEYNKQFIINEGVAAKIGINSLLKSVHT